MHACVLGEGSAAGTGGREPAYPHIPPPLSFLHNHAHPPTRLRMQEWAAGLRVVLVTSTPGGLRVPHPRLAQHHAEVRGRVSTGEVGGCVSVFGDGGLGQHHVEVSVWEWGCFTE